MDRECSTALKRIPGEYVSTKSGSEDQTRHFVLLTALFLSISVSQCIVFFMASL